MFCPKCGSQVPDGIKFCPTCGNPMQAAAPAPQPVYQEPAPAPQPVYQDPTPAPQPVYQEPTPVVNPQPVYQDPTPVYQNPAPVYNNVYQEPAPQPVPAAVNDGGASTPILILGIIGLVCAFLPYMASIVGIIISAIARGKAKNYKANYGDVVGKAKVGANLAKAGVIVGIIMTIVWFIIIIILIILAALGRADWGSIYDSLY